METCAKILFSDIILGVLCRLAEMVVIDRNWRDGNIMSTKNKHNSVMENKKFGRYFPSQLFLKLEISGEGISVEDIPKGASQMNDEYLAV